MGVHRARPKRPQRPHRLSRTMARPRRAVHHATRGHGLRHVARQGPSTRDVSRCDRARLYVDVAAPAAILGGRRRQVGVQRQDGVEIQTRCVRPSGWWMSLSRSGLPPSLTCAAGAPLTSRPAAHTVDTRAVGVQNKRRDGLVLPAVRPSANATWRRHVIMDTATRVAPARAPATNGRTSVAHSSLSAVLAGYPTGVRCNLEGAELWSPK